MSSRSWRYEKLPEWKGKYTRLHIRISRDEFRRMRSLLDRRGLTWIGFLRWAYGRLLSERLPGRSDDVVRRDITEDVARMFAEACEQQALQRERMARDLSARAPVLAKRMLQEAGRWEDAADWALMVVMDFEARRESAAAKSPSANGAQSNRTPSSASSLARLADQALQSSNRPSRMHIETNTDTIG